MCLIGFSLGDPVHPGVPALLLAANRDEYYARPTDVAHWWGAQRQLFGGRDRQAGGTWLAVNRSGRLAALTNFREPNASASNPRSRGNLVVAALDGRQPAERQVQQIARDGSAFAGFSLLVFDWSTGSMQAWCVSNRSSNTVQALGPGIYALSNGEFDAPWPKALRLKASLDLALAAEPGARQQQLLATLTDGTFSDSLTADLPDTGVGSALERELAPAYIHTSARGYGTRSTTILSLSGLAHIEMNEWTWAAASRAVATTLRGTSFDTQLD